MYSKKKYTLIHELRQIKPEAPTLSSQKHLILAYSVFFLSFFFFREGGGGAGKGFSNYDKKSNMLGTQ
jgi:hypothetical protein